MGQKKGFGFFLFLLTDSIDNEKKTLQFFYCEEYEN